MKHAIISLVSHNKIMYINLSVVIHSFFIEYMTLFRIKYF